MGCRRDADFPNRRPQAPGLGWHWRNACRGRFNSAGKPVIYGALTYAGAMLEILVHARIGKVPTTQVSVMAEVPDGVSVEQAPAEALPDGWDRPDSAAARQFGDLWLSEARSAVLLVPSVVARSEWNALVNPNHPESARITSSSPTPVIWDQRLFLAASSAPDSD